MSSRRRAAPSSLRRSVSRRSRPRSSGAGPRNNTTPLLLTDGKSKPNARETLYTQLIMAGIAVLVVGLLVLLHFMRYTDKIDLDDE